MYQQRGSLVWLRPVEDVDDRGVARTWLFELRRAARRLALLCIINAMTMTKQQFDLLARLMRSKEPVTTGAKLVLLGGVSNAEAAWTAGVTPQSVHRAVKRFAALHEEISRSYAKVSAQAAKR